MDARAATSIFREQDFRTPTIPRCLPTACSVFSIRRCARRSPMRLFISRKPARAEKSGSVPCLPDGRSRETPARAGFRGPCRFQLGYIRRRYFADRAWRQCCFQHLLFHQLGFDERFPRQWLRHLRCVSVHRRSDLWELSLVGRNITDEVITSTSGGRPFLPPGGDDLILTQNRGRLLFIRGTVRF